MDRLEEAVMSDDFGKIMRFLKRKSGRKSRNLKRLNRYFNRWWKFKGNDKTENRGK